MVGLQPVPEEKLRLRREAVWFAQGHSVSRISAPEKRGRAEPSGVPAMGGVLRQEDCLR